MEAIIAKTINEILDKFIIGGAIYDGAYVIDYICGNYFHLAGK